MKFALTTATVAVLAATLFSGAASARPSSFERQIGHIEHKIEAGRRSGKITFIEGRKLHVLIRRARGLHDQFTADGRVTAHEARVLRQEIAFIEGRVRSERRDGWQRLPILPRVGA